MTIFEPIPTVVFATNNSRYVLDKHAKIVYENSLAVMTWTLTMNNIPKSRHGLPSWSQIEHKMYSRYAQSHQNYASLISYLFTAKYEKYAFAVKNLFYGIAFKKLISRFVLLYKIQTHARSNDQS